MSPPPSPSSPSFSTHAASTEIYTLSLHDALPISRTVRGAWPALRQEVQQVAAALEDQRRDHVRSEEHTSELQSRGHLVCRLLLEKKKKKNNNSNKTTPEKGLTKN